MDGFRALGFPHCVGAVDGTHIWIVSPVRQAKDFINRKNFYSMVLQGTTDHRGRFIDVETGWSGKNHDAYIFANSALCETMDAEAFVPDQPTIRLGGQQIPPLVLGDCAYPLRPWLMRPYGGALTAQQAHFNRCHTRARIVVEQAFGRLKARWRAIGARLEMAEENVPSVVAACCILHNICETKGHVLEGDIPPHNAIELATLGAPRVNRDAERNQGGNDVRNAVAGYLWARRRR